MDAYDLLQATLELQKSTAAALQETREQLNTALKIIDRLTQDGAPAKGLDTTPRSRPRLAPDGTTATMLKDATPGARTVLELLASGPATWAELVAAVGADYEKRNPGKKAHPVETRKGAGKSLRWAREIAERHGFEIAGDKESSFRLGKAAEAAPEAGAAPREELTEDEIWARNALRIQREARERKKKNQS